LGYLNESEFEIATRYALAMTQAEPFSQQ